jgi:hypothetical protein
VSDAVITAITKTTRRKSLYHFTRARNLQTIAHFDALLSSSNISSHSASERRTEAKVVNYNEHSITINAHLRIPDSMIDVTTTQEQFRACLDQQVFFWPTLKDCQKMLNIYSRREPDEEFAVLEFDAYSLLLAHYSAVKLSKYDSGSSPRFPARCSYKKSPDMFLPLNCFKNVKNNTVPTKASEIREIIIKDQVFNVSKYLRSVYVDNCKMVPNYWRHLSKPLADLYVMNERLNRLK